MDETRRDGLAADKSMSSRPVVRESLPEAAALPDRFIAGKVLGRGGMGVVVRARDKTLGRDVAVKLLSERLRSDPELRGRLVKEARAAASLRHPGVVAVYDVDPEAAFLVMELVEGRSLHTVLREDGALSVTEVRRVGLALLDALAAAHDLGIVHRDVKPSNVLLTPEREVKLTDFGIAFLEGSERTRDGLLFGTPGYMPPEQSRGARVDGRADVYAAGAMLFELLVGSRLHGKDGSVEDILGALKEAGADPGLAHAIALAVRDRPEERHASARAFAKALESTAAPAEESVGGWLRARPALVLVVCIGALALGASAATFTPPAETTEPPSSEIGEPEPDETGIVLVILPFENRSRAPRLDFAAAGLPQLLRMELQQADELEVLPNYRLHETVEYDSAASEWIHAARELGANRVVRGVLTDSGGEVELDVRVETIDGAELARLERTVGEPEVGNAIRAWTGAIASTLLGHDVEVELSPRPLDLDRELQLGIVALERHDLGGADRHLQAALELDTESADVHYYLTILMWWTGRPTALVRTHLEAASRGGLGGARAGFLAGLEQHLAGTHRLSVATLRQVVEDYPNDRDALYGLFEAQFHGGEPSEAVDTFRRLLAVAPSFRLGLMHVINYYGARGDVENMEWAFSLSMQRAGSANELFGRRAMLRRDWVALTQESLRRLEGDERRARPTHLASTARAYALSGEMGLARAFSDRMRRRDAITSQTRLFLELAAGDEARIRRAGARALENTEAEANAHTRFFRLLPLGCALLPSASPELAIELRSAFDRLVRADLRSDGRARLLRLLADERAADEEAIQVAAESDHPEVVAVAQAMLAERSGNPAEAARLFGEAADRSAAGTFRFYELYRSAHALRDAGDLDGAAEACVDVIDPPLLTDSWAATVRDCLAWTEEAHRAAGRDADADRAGARLARLSR